MKRIIKALSLAILLISLLAVLDEGAHTLIFTLMEKSLGLCGLAAGYLLLVKVKPELRDIDIDR